MVGHATLIRQFPLFAQFTQGFLHLASAENRLRFRRSLTLCCGRCGLEQGLGLGHQFGAQLIGTPTLPAFQLAGGRQSQLSLMLHALGQHSRLLTQNLSQGIGRSGTGLAMSLG